MRSSLLLLPLFVLSACPSPTHTKIPAPAPAKDIQREAVKITGGYTELLAEVTIPAGLGPNERRPGIVLVSGSGPTDMDETIPGTLTADGKDAKLFGQLADSLTRAGFIVLRYNKRGVQKPVTDIADARVHPEKYLVLKDFETISRNELLVDAKHAVAFLRSDARVAGVSVLGHSEGAMLAPIMATADPAIRSIMLLGVPARNLKDILYYQGVELQLSIVPELMDKNKDGSVSPEEIPDQYKAVMPFELIDKNKDKLISMQELRSVLEDQYQKMLTDVESGEATELYNGLPKGWYRSWFKAESNQSVLVRLRDMPVLIIQGEDDVQTPLVEAKSIYEAMLKAGKKEVTLKTYPGLGHGFAPRREGLPTVGPIDEKVLVDIASWARKTLFL